MVKNPPITLVAIKKHVTSGTRNYPIFISFLPASQILAIAAAPAFTDKTDHHDIAKNVLAPPIKQWQRPLDQGRTQAISDLFNSTGEFMPNPVLLSENIFIGGHISVSPRLESGIQTGTHEILITVPVGNDKPLWVLDGQHRINGLAASAQRLDPVPLVLLLNEGGGFYDGPTLAKIFAQVTTEATKLQPLHDEWLTFAFGLGKYNKKTSANADGHVRAMTAVAKLCSETRFKNENRGSTPNPFLNRVQFNDHAPTPQPPPPGGFQFTCAAMESYFYKYYFSQPLTSPGAHLSPNDFARQFLLAHDALGKLVSMRNKSVFFGDASHSQVIMQEAFIAGVSARLLDAGAPASWHNLLVQLKFDQTPWDFKSWFVSLHGKVQKESKNVATSVFGRVFRDESLPAGTSYLSDFLKGDRAEVVITSYAKTPTGKRSKKSAQNTTIDGGSVKSITGAADRILTVSQVSLNIARLEITDKDAPAGRLVAYTKEFCSRKGLPIEAGRMSPLKLLITFHYYGGLVRTADLDVHP